MANLHVVVTVPSALDELGQLEHTVAVRAERIQNAVEQRLFAPQVQQHLPFRLAESAVQRRFFVQHQRINRNACDVERPNRMQIACKLPVSLSRVIVNQIDARVGNPARHRSRHPSGGCGTASPSSEQPARAVVKGLYPDRKPVDAARNERIEHSVGQFGRRRFHADFSVRRDTEMRMQRGQHGGHLRGRQRRRRAAAEIHRLHGRLHIGENTHPADLPNQLFMIGPPVERVRAVERAKAAHLVAEGDMDINHSSALRAARQHRRQVRFARDRRCVPVFQISGRVVMAFVPNGVH